MGTQLRINNEPYAWRATDLLTYFPNCRRQKKSESRCGLFKHRSSLNHLPPFVPFILLLLMSRTNCSSVFCSYFMLPFLSVSIHINPFESRWWEKHAELNTRLYLRRTSSVFHPHPASSSQHCPALSPLVASACNCGSILYLFRRIEDYLFRENLHKGTDGGLFTDFSPL